MNIVEFHNVSKIYYRHGERMLLRNRLQQLLSRKKPESFAAVKNVSFTMERGESMAIIGPNGAGKNTSLQPGGRPLQCRFRFHPSERARGRLARAWLRLSPGPDRARIMFASTPRSSACPASVPTSCLTLLLSSPASAMSSSIEPLRTYSSGMIMRLAFSVAINMDPDVLLVDEILSRWAIPPSSKSAFKEYTNFAIRAVACFVYPTLPGWCRACAKKPSGWTMARWGDERPDR